MRKGEAMDYLNYNQVNSLRQKQKEASRAKFLEDCRKRLDKIISKKIETTFIGALDSFEKHFGFLWGQDKDEDAKLTKQEIQMENLWEACRTDILNKGNLQKRSASNEINQNTVQWNRYHLDMPIKDIDQNS